MRREHRSGHTPCESKTAADIAMQIDMIAAGTAMRIDMIAAGISHANQYHRRGLDGHALSCAAGEKEMRSITSQRAYAM